MYEHLLDIRVVELSAFVAAPLAGMTLAELGCDVIRVDRLSGGLDFGRWPLTPEGESVYWRGLNKAKRSVAVDLYRPEGVELVAALATAPGEGGGVVLTNLPQPEALTYEGLRARRGDVVSVEIQGYQNGRSAVDYLIAARTGVPNLAGHSGLAGPVNSPLPTWDVVTALSAAMAAVVAIRRREQTGEGDRVQVALADVALSVLSSLGFVDEERVASQGRRRDGNYLYGAFGRDFALADGSYVMVVAITRKQWNSLVRALSISEEVRRIEEKEGVDLSTEGDRYLARGQIAELVERWCASRTLPEVEEAFERHGVAWSPYETATSFADACLEHLREAGQVTEFKGASGPYRAVDVAPRFTGGSSRPLRAAPRLGEHTEEVLAEVLGLSQREISRLVAQKVVATGDGLTSRDSMGWLR